MKVNALRYFAGMTLLGMLLTGLVALAEPQPVTRVQDIGSGFRFEEQTWGPFPAGCPFGCKKGEKTCCCAANCGKDCCQGKTCGECEECRKMMKCDCASKCAGTPRKEKAKPAPEHVYPAMGSIERLDPELDVLIPPGSEIEKLAEGFEWSEGPVWDKKGDCLYLSDVPRNVVFKWKEGVGTREFLLPSGYTEPVARPGESGSNGLTLDAKGRLVLCQHGDRRVARLEKDGRFTPLARYYQFRRFNSPNDLAYHSSGALYFTDPPYGLEKGNNDPRKELLFSGVYRVDKQGQVTLLTRDLTFPNGLAFSPDEKVLYVAVSDPAKPMIMAYDIKEDGTLDNGRVFFDATSLVPNRKGLPDGLKVDQAGNLFATGPGGVLVLSKEGKHLGTINTGEATANCAFGGNGSVLYITADMFLCRVQTATRGTGF